MLAEYDGRQVVGIDLHRRRSVIVRMTEAGKQLVTVRITNDPVAFELEIARRVSAGGVGGHLRVGAAPVSHRPLEAI
jgi:hypothetical protein